MKLLMISKSQVVGAYHGKLSELARSGVDVTVIVPPHWGNQALEICEAPEYRIRVLPCRFSGHNHFYFYTAAIDPMDADLVHLEEEPWSLVAYQCLRQCVKYRKPAVVFTWQNIFKRYPPPFNYFERYTYAHVRAAIAGNEEARQILLAKGFSQPISVIPQLGIDPKLFRKREVPELRRNLRLEGLFAIGYVGRIVEEKGIADLIRALVRLPEGCVLVLVGDGEYRPAAKELAERLGVAARVRWVPHISSLEVPDYMNAIDVLALPSRTTRRWKEQFGRVLVEAMACETPPVGSSSGEIPMVMGDAGLVFPEGAVAALADQLRSLYDNPQFLATLGRRGRARVVERFTHREIAAQTVQVYEEVLARCNGERRLTLAVR